MTREEAKQKATQMLNDAINHAFELRIRPDASLSDTERDLMLVTAYVVFSEYIHIGNSSHTPQEFLELRNKAYGFNPNEY